MVGWGTLLPPRALLSMPQRTFMVGIRSPQGPSGPGSAAVVNRLALLALLTSLCHGCATLRPAPVAENIVTARQLSLRGMDAMQHGQMEEAEAMFAMAIETNRSDERARACYAELLWRRGLHEEAIGHMQDCVRLSGGDPERQVRLGEMYLESGDLDGAWRQSEEAIRTQSCLACAWGLRADILRQDRKSVV